MTFTEKLRLANWAAKRCIRPCRCSTEDIILRQALETIVVMENAPAVVTQIARDALAKATL